MTFYQLISYETRDYYERVSKGLIKERPYDYWGPDTAERKAHWDQWWLPIQKSFYPIDWESGFTGRGIVRHDKKTLERPDLVGPLDEVLVMDEDVVSEEIVYRIDNGTSSEDGVSRGVNVRRRSCIEAASMIYIRAKEHIVAFFDLHHVTMSMRQIPSARFTRSLQYPANERAPPKKYGSKALNNGWISSPAPPKKASHRLFEGATGGISTANRAMSTESLARLIPGKPNTESSHRMTAQIPSIQTNRGSRQKARRLKPIVGNNYSAYNKQSNKENYELNAITIQILWQSTFKEDHTDWNLKGTKKYQTYHHISPRTQEIGLHIKSRVPAIPST